MIKNIASAIAAVAVVELRHDIAEIVRYVAKETRRTVREKFDASRQ
jgi:hypothetical protein